MPYFDGIRNRIYYRRWAIDSPRAQVLLLHGFGEHTGHYHRLARQLNAAEVEVWAPDHLGHGHTGGSPGAFASVDELAINAGILLDQMPPLPTTVVGHSLGAMAGALLAIHNPGVRTGLIMSAAPLWGPPPDLGSSWAPMLTQDESSIDGHANDPFAFDIVATEPDLWRTMTVAGCKIRNGLPAISMPVVLINGELDVLAPPSKASRFAANLQHGRALTVAGGHALPNGVVHYEVGSIIIDAVAQWCVLDAGTLLKAPY